jgi:hypothetical protein
VSRFYAIFYFLTIFLFSYFPYFLGTNRIKKSPQKRAFQVFEKAGLTASVYTAWRNGEAAKALANVPANSSMEVDVVFSFVRGRSTQISPSFRVLLISTIWRHKSSLIPVSAIHFAVSSYENCAYFRSDLPIERPMTEVTSSSGVSRTGLCVWFFRVFNSVGETKWFLNLLAV